MARKKIIAGNWKMNKTPSEAVALVEELKPLVANEDLDVVFCVPAIDIVPVVEAAKGTNIQVGAENMYFEESGAYTGEISPNMLVEILLKNKSVLLQVKNYLCLKMILKSRDMPLSVVSMRKILSSTLHQAQGKLAISTYLVVVLVFVWTVLSIQAIPFHLTMIQ